MQARLLSWIPTLLLSVATAETPPQKQPQFPAPLAELDREVSRMAEQLGDWGEQYGIVSKAVENIWRRNGWNTEADLFAKSLALEVEQIPPWKLPQRLQHLTTAIKQRYRLDRAQSEQVRTLMEKEMLRMSLKYAPLILKQAREILETRLNREPFTAQQVARWVEESEPFVDSWPQDVKRITSNFRDLLAEEQRDVFDRDLESLNKRMSQLLLDRQSWKQGNWQPEDWGLQDDPIHIRAKQTLETAAMRIAGNSVVLPHDESTWANYVADFVSLYKLDEAQQQTCVAILQDLGAQAKDYRATHHNEIDSIAPTERSSHPMLAPICERFAELQARLELIPLQRQRREASEQPTAGSKP